MDYYEPNLSIHESGHVIMRMIDLYGIAGQIDFIKISIDEEHGGSVYANPMFTDAELRNFDLERYPDLELTSRKLRKEAVINVAGIAAECILNNRPIPDLTSTNEGDIASDLTKFQMYCMKILKTQGVVSSSASFNAEINILNSNIFQDALAIFKTEKYNAATIFLVESLERDKIFTGNKLKNIIREIQLMLI